MHGPWLALGARFRSCPYHIQTHGCTHGRSWLSAPVFRTPRPRTLRLGCRLALSCSSAREPGRTHQHNHQCRYHQHTGPLACWPAHRHTTSDPTSQGLCSTRPRTRRHRGIGRRGSRRRSRTGPSCGGRYRSWDGTLVGPAHTRSRAPCCSNRRWGRGRCGWSRPEGGRSAHPGCGGVSKKVGRES